MCAAAALYNTSVCVSSTVLKTRAVAVSAFNIPFTPRGYNTCHCIVSHKYHKFNHGPPHSNNMPLFRTSSEYPLDIPVRQAGMATSGVAVPPPNPDSTPTRPQNGTYDAATDGSTTPRRRSVIDSAVLTTLSPLIDAVIEQSLQEVLL